MAGVGINEINFFPDFKPLQEGDPKWEEGATHCNSCHNEFHFIIGKDHCRVCGYTFCKPCCAPQRIYNNYPACGACVGNGSMMIKRRYDDKRQAQLSAHAAKYHKSEHEEHQKKEAEEQSKPKKETDDLYGRAFEGLARLEVKQTKAASDAPQVDPSEIGINEINFFPGFKPMTSDDPNWQQKTADDTHCPECQNEFHALTNRPTNCENCGGLFCNRCAHEQRVFNNHITCGACTAGALTMVKNKYVGKREAQLKAHHAKYHAKDAKEKQDQPPLPPQSEVDELYGKAFDHLTKELKQSGNLGDQIAAEVGGINDVVFFPDFKPLTEADDKWEKKPGTHCPECQNEFHPITHQQTHCTVCGFVYCNHCCTPQKVYNENYACGQCVTNGMMMIKKRYDEKRKTQLAAYHKKYGKKQPDVEGAEAEKKEAE